MLAPKLVNCSGMISRCDLIGGDVWLEGQLRGFKAHAISHIISFCSSVMHACLPAAMFSTMTVMDSNSLEP